MIIKLSLEDYLNTKIKNLKCHRDTSAYILNTLCNYKNSVYDFQNKSLTLEFAEAKFNVSYQRMQDLADYILFMEATYPKSLCGASSEYYHSIAQMAYNKCYILMNRSWKLYEELSDRFPEIIEQLHNDTIRA